jgi:rhodanese-related sulfurtransferase
VKMKFITLEDLLEMRANDEKYKLVEVLPEEEYEAGHIIGAINIPLDKLEAPTRQKLKKADTIVVYCASYSCQASTKMAKRLLEMGYKGTLDFKGGKRWWRHAGLELQRWFELGAPNLQNSACCIQFVRDSVVEER